MSNQKNKRDLALVKLEAFRSKIQEKQEFPSGIPEKAGSKSGIKRSGSSQTATLVLCLPEREDDTVMCLLLRCSNSLFLSPRSLAVPRKKGGGSGL